MILKFRVLKVIASFAVLLTTRVICEADVSSVEINYLNATEIVVNTISPVTGTPTKNNFSVILDGTMQPIESVCIRNHGTSLVVKMTHEISLPRDVMNLPQLKLVYNGNDDIKDANNIKLPAFEKEISFRTYAENLWRFWGKFEDKSSRPYPKSWVNKNIVSDGWDWSLPDFVTASPLANFWYRSTPGINSPSRVWCNNLNSVYIGWADLEPEEGKYNFELLRKMIIDNSIGFDGVTLRLLAACWKVESYPAPGGNVPEWLAARKNAPRWMENMNIAKIPGRKAIDNKFLTVNLDIMNPEYHSRYLKLISELGKSGIPQMPQLKIVNVCYRSGSAGEEFDPYDSKNNPTEAQYPDTLVDRRTRERLKAWADAFGDNRYKLMYVGSTEKAQVSYAGVLGIGTRNGFVEMYNSTVQMPHFGMTINKDRYVDVDETNNFIKKKLPFGDENEEYSNEGRFGYKESFPYRYYITSFRMLQMRRNYVMHDASTLNPELTWYVGLNLGRKIEDAPDAFVLLSEFYISKYANEGNAGPVKNIERWLYQRDVPGYMTTPAMKVPTAKDLWYADNTKPFDFTARKGKKMGFDVDNRMFPAGENEMAVKISFYDGVPGTLKLLYENNHGIQTESVVATGTNKVRTATFFIKSTLAPKALKFDFELHSDEEVPVFFVRVIKTKNVTALKK